MMNPEKSFYLVKTLFLFLTEKGAPLSKYF